MTITIDPKRQAGEIYVWDTDQALGYDIKRKFHVYICEAGRRADGHAFLFISSANYVGDYKILSADYAFLVRDSFVSCRGIVTYPDADIVAAKPQLIGRLSKVHMAKLFKAISASEAMVSWQIRLCCEALKGSLT